MKLKFVVDEDFVNYKKCSMFIGTATCDWKCCREAKCDICQNLPLATDPTLDIDDYNLVQRYINNPLTQAIVIGGLEPFDQFEEVLHLVQMLRLKTNDDIVIYTGYNHNEIEKYVYLLGDFDNIIIKFGRYIPDAPSRFDAVLGVELASDNQYAARIGRNENNSK